MTNALKAELRSIYYTRATMLAALDPGRDRRTRRARRPPDQADRPATARDGRAVTRDPIAGAIAGGSEYQHRTIEWTLLGTPRRRTAGTAKLVAAMLLGACAGALTLAVTWSIAAVVNPGMLVGVPVGTLIAGQLALGALTCAFGLACGLALRNLPAAIGTVLMIALGAADHLPGQTQPGARHPVPPLRRAISRRARARLLPRQRRQPTTSPRRRSSTTRLDRTNRHDRAHTADQDRRMTATNHPPTESRGDHSTPSSGPITIAHRRAKYSSA